MPINTVRDRKGRPRFEFEFSRRLDGRRVRCRKLLPATWNRTQADAFDRQESGRLYAQASGVQARDWLIDDAIARYVDERAPELKTGREIASELAALAPYWQGRPLSALHAVCAAITRDFRGVIAPATLMNRLRYLISASRWGWERHRMGEHDPGAGIPMPTVKNARHVYPKRALMLQIARACPRRNVRAAIRVAFYSGMRRGEILRAIEGDDAFVLEDTKNGERRLVPIHPKIRCCAGYEWPSKYVLGYWFRKARAAVGRSDVHFHDLRHGTASALLAAGVDRRIVGKILGHKSAASTNRYEHLALETAREALGRIGSRATASTSSPPGRARKKPTSPREAPAGGEPTSSGLQSNKRA